MRNLSNLLKQILILNRKYYRALSIAFIEKANILKKCVLINQFILCFQ